MRVVERYRRRDFRYLDVEIAINDPNMYTKPFTIKVTHLLQADSDILEYFCAENGKDRTRIPTKCGTPVQRLSRGNSIGEQCADFNGGERKVHRVKKPVWRVRRDRRDAQRRSGLLPLCGGCDTEDQHAPKRDNGIRQRRACHGERLPREPVAGGTRLRARVHPGALRVAVR